MNKNNFFVVNKLLLFFLFVVCLLSACSKDEDSTSEGGKSKDNKPTVNLISFTKDKNFNVSIVYKVDIKIANDGGSKITKKGVCYGTTSECSYTSTSITNSDKAPQYTVAITPLRKNTKYFIKAFATNEKGTGYSAVTSFVAQ